MLLYTLRNSKYKLVINGEKYETKVLSFQGNYAKVSVTGVDYEIDIEQEARHTKETGPRSTSISTTIAKPAAPSLPTPKIVAPKKGEVLAPIPGTVLDIKVKVGQTVTSDDIVLILEAMKMESEIPAGI